MDFKIQSTDRKIRCEWRKKCTRKTLFLLSSGIVTMIWEQTEGKITDYFWVY